MPRRELPPEFSVIICTYDRADLLAYSLNALADQKVPAVAWELLVIDNNSPDHTRELADAFFREHPEITGRCVTETQQGLSYARNRGYREAAADWVIYLDDDAKAEKNFLVRTAWLIAEGGYRIVGGVYHPWYHFGRPRWWQDRYGSNALPHTKLTVPRGNYVATGGVMLWERKLLEELGGFDPRVGMVGKRIAYGEETYLQAKARARGIAVAYDPELIIYHVVMAQKLSVDWFFQSHYAAGRDAVLGGEIPTGARSAAAQLLLGLAVMSKDFMLRTPSLFRDDYYLENWVIDVFRKLAKRVGSAYTALLHHR